MEVSYLPFGNITFVIVMVAFLVAVTVVAAAQARKAQRKARRKAYADGWKWCLRVHGMFTAEPDRDGILAFEPDGDDMARTWERGYLAALDAHDLPLSDMDRQELWHNRYAGDDRDAAVSAAGAQVAAAVNMQTAASRRY